MILHISNDFSGSTVYKNLIGNLDWLGFPQMIYNPVREISRINKNKIDLENRESQIMYSHILNNFSDRLFYQKKIAKILKDIESTIDLKKIKIIHAHTWYSDGGVAYEIYKRYEIPYIVTIRNTDLNYFFKYMTYLRRYGLQILENAQKIIFISPVYFKRLFSHNYFNLNKTFLESKSIIIPNGVDDFWVEKQEPRKKIVNGTLKLLYIGKFNKGKNVFRLIQAVEKLNQMGLPAHLSLVGKDGNEFNKIMTYIRNKKNFSYHGMILDKEDLKTVFLQNDVFAMPSHAETFGLVYIEALSQGIPVLYTIDEGIYGFYNNIGEAVNSRSVSAIANGIRELYHNYSKYNFDPKEIVENHDWSKIARKYVLIYNEILN